MNNMDKVEESNLKFAGRFKFEAFRDGKPLWTEYIPKNIVVNEGIQLLMDDGLNGPAGLYVGLLGNITPSATTALAAVAAVEVTAYTGNRPAWTWVRTAQTASNTASTADFVITSDSTVIYGGFVANANTGSVGTLLAAKQFSGGSKTLDTDDEIKITYEIVGSSA